ncbi:MAG: hypothetical protein VB064_09185 [Oscillospiraceae bacterium]|nr:hypothetical protein [Oscillospiraceae bacterium]
MAWYWIAAIVICALFIIAFIVYITNADMKMIEIIYNKLLAFHDGRDVEEKI